MSFLEELNSRGKGTLPGLIGIEVTEVEEGRLASWLDLREELIAPNGYLHAAAIIALADTSCGYGTFASLPEGAEGFTTIELKSNFLGTKHEGAIKCEARLAHGGRATQVWDATVTDAESGKTLALFRCTQMILYPRNDRQRQESLKRAKRRVISLEGNINLHPVDVRALRPLLRLRRWPVQDGEPTVDQETPGVSARRPKRTPRPETLLMLSKRIKAFRQLGR